LTFWSVCVVRNVGSIWLLLVVNIGVTYIQTPFVIHHLGNEGYGLWTLLTAISGYIGLLALGVPMATVRYIAQHLAEGDPRKVNSTIGSCAGLYLMVGAAALVVAGVCGLALNAFKIPPGLEHQAHLSFAVMAVYVAGGFIGLLPEGILFAHHDFAVRALVRIAAIVLRLALTLALLAWHPSLVVLASIQLFALMVDFALSVWLIYRRHPGVRISLADFDWRTVREILSFSLFVLLLGAGARLSFETDALVIGRFVNIAAIPFYVVANSLIVYLMDFVNSIAAVVSPMATRLHTEGRLDELGAMFLKWSKIALSLSLMAGLFLIVLGPRFLGWWIDPSYERPSGAVLQILMLSSFVFLPVRGVALPILMGIGKPRIPAIGFLVSGVLNLALSIGLAKSLGLIGVALGTAIPNVVFAVVVAIAACRELGVGLWRFATYVAPRAACGALPILALLVWFKVGLGVRGLMGLAGAGVASVAAFAVTWVFFVYWRDPLVDVMPHLVRLRAWSGE
jgi:O-antigen/teichoic acid export membrane protein